MGISSIVQIAERLLNNKSGQDTQTPEKTRATQANAQSQANRTEFGDRFTPSEQADTTNGSGGTGFLQAEQLRFTAQAIQVPTNNATTAAPAATVTPVTVPGGAGAAGPATATAPVATAGAAATSPVLTQQDLQTLNSALTALGLNAAEIAAFDQFAGVLLQFDPNALRELESQLNLLASQFQTQNAAPANTAAQITTPTTAATQAPANTPGFQLNELSVSFTGLNGALNSGNTNAPNTQFSTFNLQIKEVQVTLGNSAGQTAQLKVQGTGGHTPAPAAKSATA